MYNHFQTLQTNSKCNGQYNHNEHPLLKNYMYCYNNQKIIPNTCTIDSKCYNQPNDMSQKKRKKLTIE